MIVLKNLDKLTPPVRKMLNTYLKKLIHILNKDVYSVILFGSGATEDFIYKKSNINLLLVCNEFNISRFNKCRKIINWGRKRGIVAPLVLTQTYIKNSADVFPMEFMEMQDSRLPLYGEDILGNLNIGTEHLRLECEQQLKGKLMRLRQTFLEIGARTEVITESINSLLPIFRTLHRLRGIPVPGKKGQLIASLSGIGVDTEVFLLALDIKRGKYKLKRKELEPFLVKYVAEIEKLCEWIDRFRGKLTTVGKKR